MLFMKLRLSLVHVLMLSQSLVVDGDFLLSLSALPPLPPSSSASMSAAAAAAAPETPFSAAAPPFAVEWGVWGAGLPGPTPRVEAKQPQRRRTRALLLTRPLHAARRWPPSSVGATATELPPHHIFGCESRPRRHYGTPAASGVGHEHYSHQEGGGRRAGCPAAPRAPPMVLRGGHELGEGSAVASWRRQHKGKQGKLVLNKEMSWDPHSKAGTA